MVCKEVIRQIEEVYAKSYAMSWDNVGLLAGRYEKEVNKIYVALDATDEVIDAAIEENADMLITHHPLIFSGMKKITDDDMIGNRLIRLIQNDISYYAMHTNYDVLGMADLSGMKMNFENPEVLEVTVCDEKPEGIGKIADLEQQITLRECCQDVKDIFNLDSVKVFGNLDGMVKRVAICPGSGKSTIPEALKKGADVLITGDIGHHEGIDAVSQNLAIIDAGHYGIEHIFIEDMVQFLGTKFEKICVKGAPIIHPFAVI